MADLEKVIKGIEHCLQGGRGCLTYCPYLEHDNCKTRLKKDALELLKRQQRTGIWVDEHCSKCGKYVYHGNADNYCPHCGARMTGGTMK